MTIFIRFLGTAVDSGHIACQGAVCTADQCHCWAAAVVKRISEKLGENFASMDELLAYRKKAREEKNWEVADKIRTAFDAENIILKDTKDGTTWEVK